jgi:hypothetical protein
VTVGARQIPGSGPTRRRLHSGRFKSPVHTATTDVQRRRDVSHRASGFEEFRGLISFELTASAPCSDSRPAPSR